MSAATDIKQFTKKIGQNDYVMVAGRVILAHQDNPEALSIRTELIQDNDDFVTMKAIVVTRKGEFDGHATSYKQTGSQFEKKTPLEVAETSAVGRALGLAGYAIENGIASADEMDKAEDYGNRERPPQSNVRALPQKERQQVEQQVEAERGTTKGEYARQITTISEGFNLETPQLVKIVSYLTGGKNSRELTINGMRLLAEKMAAIKSRDEALGLVDKYDVAQSKNTDEDLFDEEEANTPEPKTQREEDAENAKTYTNDKPLVGGITEKQVKMVQAITRGAGHEAAMEAYGVGLSDLSKAQGSDLITQLKAEEAQ